MQATEETTKQDILDHMHNVGWKLVKADPVTKGGVQDEWQNREASVEAVRRHVRRGGGVGVQVGEVSGWLAVADADHEYAIALAPEFLPKTLRQAKGQEISHYFCYSKGLGFKKFKDLNAKTLIDLKASDNGAGHLVIVEPTKHPDKGAYRFAGGFNPASIADVPAEKLRRTVGLWACATLIATNLPKSKEEGGGGRHDVAMALAGYALRNGWTPEETLKVVKAAWKVRGAPGRAFTDLEGIVADTAGKMARNEPVTGGRTLEELVPGLAARIARFMDWERPDKREGRAHNLTDMGNAERFVDAHGNGVRYCYEWKSWLVYDGTRWVRDVGAGRVHKLAKETVRAMYREAADVSDESERKAIAKHATSSEAARRIKDMLSLAEPEVPITPEQLDSDPYLLNCLNGTIDLRTGDLLDHDRSDYLTKLAPVEYASEAKAPTWEGFLERVQRNKEVRAFLKRAIGYSATGDTSEQCMFINHGVGANGKSTFQEALTTVLGDYAQRVPTEMLMSKRPGGVPNDVARLKGARFATASETEEGRRLAESLVKDLTGSDRLVARFMKAEFFEFEPSHKLCLSTNHKPEIRGTDLAIWRRIRLIPWSVKIPPEEQDRKLPEKLRNEREGILAWIVAGCLEWMQQGLNAPDEVRQATKEYRAEMDVLAGFLADCCEQGKDKREFAGELWDAFKNWCEATGEHEGSQKKFGGRLSERGFLNDRDSRTGRKVWFGVSLLPDWKVRADVPLNHPSLRFAGNSEEPEPSEPKTHISPEKKHLRGGVCKNGSDGSDGSDGSEDELFGGRI